MDKQFLTNHQDFLVEIGTEELPPTNLLQLGDELLNNITALIKKHQLSFTDGKFLVTPRRLSIQLQALQITQPDQWLERKGPNISVAMQNGQPTPALLGFAKSCKSSIQDLSIIKTSKGDRFVCRTLKKGSHVKELIPEIIKKALQNLSIKKTMRWSDKNYNFIRPVHWLIVLLGKDIIPCKLMGCNSDRITKGHRIHHPADLSIPEPSAYENLLYKGYVITDFNQRKQEIIKQTKQQASQLNGIAIIEDNLLEEITGLVEWPIAISGKFSNNFLKMPREILISSMQNNQKYFPVKNTKNELLPYFICITNLKSQNVEKVVSGYEKVLYSRLEDAYFFYKQDRKTTLHEKRKQLKNVIFQQKLGTLFDKTERLTKLTEWLTAKIIQIKNSSIATTLAKTAGCLAKADLVTEIVKEFPELQGITGRYSAHEEQLDEQIAIALEEQYLPRFAGDRLPETIIGQALAIADKIDTITGIFAIDQSPSGNKDPFALRRAALGILRILIEKKLPLSMNLIITKAIENYNQNILQSPTNLIDKITNFINERFKSWCITKNIPTEVFIAVQSVQPSKPYDFYLRIQATQMFKKLPEAEYLIQANKRVTNILANTNQELNNIDKSLLKTAEEKKLHQIIIETKQKIANMPAYVDQYKALALLKQPIDDFFENVLVNDNNPEIRLNRYILLHQLLLLFRKIADIAKIQ